MLETALGVVGCTADSDRFQTCCYAGSLRGGTADAAMVDVRDIAEVAAAVLAGKTPVEGHAVALTGAERLTFEDIAAVASQSFARPVQFARQTSDEVRSTLLRSGQPHWYIEILLQFNEVFIRGWGEEIRDTVHRVLGRARRTLEAYLDELAEGAQATGGNPFPSCRLPRDPPGTSRPWPSVFSL